MKIEEVLIGKRIRIRDYVRADRDFVTDMWLDVENGRYLSDPTREHVDAVYQKALDGLEDSPHGYYLVAERSADGARIGSCCAFPDADGVADIGYCIHRDCWRQGYGRELVQCICGWLCSIGMRYVTAEVAVENAASCALLDHCGFRVVREAEFKKYHMDVCYRSCIWQKEL